MMEDGEAGARGQLHASELGIFYATCRRTKLYMIEEPVTVYWDYRLGIML
jgi:hypothetical protein